MRFSAAEKLQCAERELQMRKRVYPGRIANHRMSEGMAERELQLMQAIVDDYRELADKDRLL